MRRGPLGEQSGGGEVCRRLRDLVQMVPRHRPFHHGEETLEVDLLGVESEEPVTALQDRRGEVAVEGELEVAARELRPAFQSWAGVCVYGLYGLSEII